MGEATKIEWADHTFNPVIGCAKVSPGCDNCYAEAWAHRFGVHDWNNATPRHVTSDANWRLPLRWNRQAEADGVHRRVFCASLADVFDLQWPDSVRDRLWELIEATPWLIWMLLTKRPNLMQYSAPRQWLNNVWPDNVWLGFTAEDQKHYDRRWPYMATQDVAVRFVSYEPALGPLELRPYEFGFAEHRHQVRPDWVICGGESGPGARPMTPDWARRLQRECHAHGVPFFLKQWGTYASNPLVVDGKIIYLDAATAPQRSRFEPPVRFYTEADAAEVDPPTNGKGGALLDLVLHRQVPSVTPPAPASARSASQAVPMPRRRSSG